MKRKIFTKANFLNEFLPIICMWVLALIVYLILRNFPDKFPRAYASFYFSLTCTIPLLFFLLFDIRLPWILKITYFVFLIVSMLFSMAFSIYSYALWYDSFLHAISGIVVCLFAHYIIIYIDRKNSLNYMPKLFLIICINALLSLLWEVAEFATDTFMASNAQHVIDTGNLDTMFDILYNFIGVGVYSITYLLDQAIFKGKYRSKLEEKLSVNFPPLK